MPKKVKSPTCSTGWCKHHLFQLLPLKNTSPYYRKKMKLRLCPKHNRNLNIFQGTMPEVNKDHKHYTPCFILQEEKNYYQNNDERLQNTHNLKLEQEATCTILVPKHGRKKNYCSVCKSEYEDYMEHVDANPHRNNLRSNKFSKYIVEMEGKMQQEKSKEISAAIQKFIDPMSKMVDQTKDIEKEKEQKT